MNIEVLKKVYEQFDACRVLLTNPSIDDATVKGLRQRPEFMFTVEGSDGVRWISLNDIDFALRFLQLTIEDETNKARLRL